VSETEKVLELFKKYNCAQAVFAACGPCEGFTEEMCLVAAGPFGGGMGRMGETCGAVTGALLTLGVRYGQEMATNPAEAREPLYTRVNDFAEAFKARHGSLICRELKDPKQPKEQALKNACRNLLVSAVELLKEQQ